MANSGHPKFITMDPIETRIKQIIIDVSQLDDQPADLDDDSSLGDLGYNDNMCRDLENRLNDFIKHEQHCNQLLNNGDISPDSTIGEVVKMVKDNLAKC
ncbi:MAG: hypothetical protein JWQ57_1649 [Mucilaginibacter sp.]|nr:hypothetical protein [Mucilaginibacter sp.]